MPWKTVELSLHTCTCIKILFSNSHYRVINYNVSVIYNGRCINELFKNIIWRTEDKKKEQKIANDNNLFWSILTIICRKYTTCIK